MEWRITRIALVVLLLGTGGCYHAYIDLGDGNHDADAAAEADAVDEIAAVPDGAVDDAVDVAEAHVDAVDDADVVSTADGAPCPGWYDPTSGLCWQDPPEETLRTLNDAVAYCDGLALGGSDTWHLPTINELRMLIRGCPNTEAGGPCGITEACLGAACWNDPCAGCPDRGGPGAGGAYWPPELRGTTSWAYSYWSSSGNADATWARAVLSESGGVYGYDGAALFHVRCVRPGP